MEITDMRPSTQEGNIKAFFKVKTEEGFVIDGFKVMNGRNGLFVSTPSKKVGEKFIETVSMPKAVKDELNQLALQEFSTLASAPPPPDQREAEGPPPERSDDLPF
jgi:DNA-binding cell septation regulator SpoVG